MSFYDALRPLLTAEVWAQRDRCSPAELLALAPEGTAQAFLSTLSRGQQNALRWDWRFWGRPKQNPPPGNWSTWLLKAGRGFGKTRTGVEWFNGRMQVHPGRWGALVAKTPADARDYLIEGPGGFLKVIRPDLRPAYEPSNRRLIWPNGSWATIYSDETPDQLRGFSGDTALLDEFAKWRNPRLCWDNLAFGMREASTDRPRRMVTTTPRPIPILKEIEAKKSTETTSGSSYENRANLDPTWFSDIILEYEGTRTGRQEIHAETVEDLPGALLTLAAIDAVRVRGALPGFKQTVIAIDPSGARTEDKQSGERAPKSDEIGIVAASLGDDERMYLREDLSVTGGPEIWGARAIAAFHAYAADHIVVETNFGGDMAAYVIRSLDANVPVKTVTASRGKHVRAEPVTALYDPKRDGVRHAGTFPKLEDQLTHFTGLGYEGARSPDRADAWIWCVTDLALSSGAQGWLEYYRRLAGARENETPAAIAPAPPVTPPSSPDFGYALAPKAADAGKIRIRVPPGNSTVYGMDGTAHAVDRDGIVSVTAETAKALERLGWERVA